MQRRRSRRRRQKYWRKPVARQPHRHRRPRRALGIAVHESFSSFVAEVAEVSAGADGMPKVERVVCARALVAAVRHAIAVRIGRVVEARALVVGVADAVAAHGHGAGADGAALVELEADPQLYGALGAALVAREKHRK